MYTLEQRLETIDEDQENHLACMLDAVEQEALEEQRVSGTFWTTCTSAWDDVMEGLHDAYIHRAQASDRSG